jgi:O-antigen ligase
MSDAGVLPDALRVSGMVLAALLAAVAVLAPRERWRAAAMLGAIAVTPLLLGAEVWESPQVETVRDRPALLAALVVAALAVQAALAVVFARRPRVFALAAVAAVPFRIPVEAGGATANLLVPLYVIIGAGALAWAGPRLKRPDEASGPRNGALEWLLLGAVVLYAVQSAYSSDVPKALAQVVFFYVPFALLFALLRGLHWDARLLRDALVVLTGLALAFAAIGFWEYQTRHLLLNPKVIASNSFEEYFRVNSLFFDPNIYGRFLVLVMLGLTSVLLWAQTPRAVRAAAAALAVLWGGLLLTLSQSSFTALLAGLAVLAFLRFPRRWTLGAAAVALAVAAVLVLGFPGAVGLEVGDRGELDDLTSGRIELVEGGIALARERPVAGWGAGAFEREFRRREAASSQRATSASHTIPVTVAAEQGLIGLAVYLALVAAALARLLGHLRPRAAHRGEPAPPAGAGVDPARAAIAAAFVALVVHTWMYAAFLEDPAAWTLLGIGVALAAAVPPRRAPSAPAAAVAA